MSTNCEICGKGPLNGGVSVLRVNKKGVPGIWRCRNCATPEQLAGRDPIVADIVDIIEKGQCSTPTPMNETNADVKGYALGALEVASGEVETNEHNPDGDCKCPNCGITHGCDQSARIAELERRVKEEESKRKETAKDFETAFRIVRLENDQLRAEVERLKTQLAEREEDRALLDEVQKRKLTITWNPRHDGFIIQEQEQVCNNIAHDRDLRAAIRAARAQPEDGK